MRKPEEIIAQALAELSYPDKHWSQLDSEFKHGCEYTAHMLLIRLGEAGIVLADREAAHVLMSFAQDMQSKDSVKLANTFHRMGTFHSRTIR